MTYSFPYHQSRDQTMMISSPTKLRHSVLTSYSDCGSPAYKNLLMYPNWQWPPTPETLSPPIHLPHLTRYNTVLPSIPSPLTPVTPPTHPAVCSVEQLSPAMCTLPSSALSQNSSPPVNISIPGVTPFSQASPLASTPTGSKRGRPRADVISSLQYFGSNSTCSIRCHICHRVFPREKSLQAHLRTHTGERPYRCDYPNCTKSFVQSGQLKTHQRLHSGEKPFKCSDEDCSVRFTHANRHCPDHPNAKLLRDDQGALEGLLVGTPRQDTAIAEWLDKYVRSRLDRTGSTQRPHFKRESSETATSSDDEGQKHENTPQQGTIDKAIMMDTPVSTGTRGLSAKRQLLADENENKVAKNDDQEEQAVRIPLSPKRINQNGQVLKIDPRHPVKKRILAYNQLMMKENQEHLKTSQATSMSSLQRPYPILPPVTSTSPKRKIVYNCDKSPTSSLSPIRSVLKLPDGSPTSPKKFSFLQELENFTSDESGKKIGLTSSVAAKGNSSPSRNEAGEDENESEPRDRWNGALALMQLASSPPSRKISSTSCDSR